MNPRPPTTTTGSGRAASDVGGPRRLWLVGGSDDGNENFDALTDLFLGEVARPRERSTREEPTTVTSRPVLRLITDAAETAEPSAPEAEAASGAAVEASSPGPAFIECVLVGNLPVLASAWVSQYVREVARAASRPVAFLRIQAGCATVELVSEGGVRDGAGAPTGDLDSAMRLAARQTARWIVRVDHGEESAVASRQGVRLVTLLTGPDEAARVNAYGAIKTLAEQLPKAGAGPVVRVAVMSTAEPSADAAGRKLVDTVKQFLGRDVQHAVCSSRIRSGRPAEVLFNGRIEATPAEVIERLERLLGCEAAEASSEQAPVVADEPAVEAAVGPASVIDPVMAMAEADLVAADAEEASEEKVLPEAATSMPTVVDGPTAAVDQRVDDVALWGAAHAEPKTAAEGVDDLAAFVAGVRPLEVRCPYAESVQIGVDAAGALHLLAHSQSPAEDERVLAGLMVAGAWAEAHAALLRAASAAAQGAAAPRPTMHLFTSAPKTSRRLLETSLRVHLLAPVSVGGQNGWFCTELN